MHDPITITITFNPATGNVKTGCADQIDQAVMLNIMTAARDSVVFQVYLHRAKEQAVKAAADAEKKKKEGIEKGTPTEDGTQGPGEPGEELASPEGAKIEEMTPPVPSEPASPESPLDTPPLLS